MLDSCSGHGTCDDSSGVVICTCDIGYAGATCDACATGYNLVEGNCVQDVTCSQDYCSGHGTCDDTGGSAVCICDAGYAGITCNACSTGYQDNNTDGTCEPACAQSGLDCGIHGHCDDSNGTPGCVCDAGYGGQYCDNAAPSIPGSPMPQDGARGVSTSSTLSWSGDDPDGDPVTFEVYLGTSTAAAALVGTVNEVSGSGAFAASDLDARTFYTWRVVASDSHGAQTEGPWWQFYTGSVNPCPLTPTVEDADGHVYNTLQIGSQCWMAENVVSGVTRTDAQSPSDDGVVEKWCPGDSPANCDIYGGLYTWDEVMQGSMANGARGLCPDGWHVPADEEWSSMTEFLQSTGGDVVPQLLEGGSSGFDAMLAGYRYYSGGYEFIDEMAHYWTSTFETSTSAYAHGVMTGDSDVWRSNWRMTTGLSVRCIKNP